MWPNDDPYLSKGSQALANNKIKSKFTPDINLMHFQLRTPCAKINFPLTNPGAMWHSPEFDPKKKVVILATGWTTTVNGSDTIEVFSKAYNCRGDVNFVVRSVDCRIGDKALPRLVALSH